jgi:predicted enzyme related to lactoylglutathione lyase
MSGPAQHGVIIYANNPDTLAQFYQQFLSMDIVRSSNDFIVLAKPGLNIIIHVPPFDMPPERFNSVKLFTSVDHLQQAQQRLLELWGKTMPGEWSNPLFTVCNVCDPEGNMLQLRQFH